ncbi:ribonuclease E inhibitor RraA/Dimethylmenaquinone methyltransferase [Amylocystis lapponica]|nr:ribonuclease E inhibitor RraA/Dimethylmenaquinone methyltransferase [Amylocystis lapponica]
MSSSTFSLGSFSSCEISDALIKLGVAHGGHIPDIHIVSPLGSSTRICGPAYTVRMVLTSDTTAPNQAKNAVWGGLMTAGAQARGALGVIISGRCRDLAEHRFAGFPVFSRGHSTLGQSPFTRPSALNVPLTINSFPAVRVEPGDWMIADEDGVVCVSPSLTEQVIELATKGREIDERCLEDIKAGTGIQAAFKKHRGKL